MASFFCHGFGVTKQVRLERIVRPTPNDASVTLWLRRRRWRAMRSKEILHDDRLTLKIQDVTCNEGARHPIWMSNAVSPKELSELIVLPEPKAIANARAKAMVQFPVVFLRQREKLLLH